MPRSVPCFFSPNLFLKEGKVAIRTADQKCWNVGNPGAIIPKDQSVSTHSRRLCHKSRRTFFPSVLLLTRWKLFIAWNAGSCIDQPKNDKLTQHEKMSRVCWLANWRIPLGAEVIDAYITQKRKSKSKSKTTKLKSNSDLKKWTFWTVTNFRQSSKSTVFSVQAPKRSNSGNFSTHHI